MASNCLQVHYTCTPAHLLTSTPAGKVSSRGPPVLWHGALAAASATAVGHFPWFLTFNFLQVRHGSASSVAGQMYTKRKEERENS